MAKIVGALSQWTDQLFSLQSRDTKVILRFRSAQFLVVERRKRLAFWESMDTNETRTRMTKAKFQPKSCPFNLFNFGKVAEMSEITLGS